MYIYIYIYIYIQSFFICILKNLKIFHLDLIKKIKEKIKKTSGENLAKEERKRKTQEYGHQQYKNLSENEKQKLVKYRKRSYEMQKNKNLL